MTIAEHSHVMGGSTAAQRINCPGSLELESEMPERGESDFAKQGTVFHAAMELLITADPQDMEDAEALLDDLEGNDLGFGEEWEITREQIDAKIRPALAAWFEVLDEYELDDWLIEQRVSLDTVVEGAFGTADIVAIDKSNRLHVLDWKFGDGVPVPAEGNMGIGFYAACVLYDEDHAELEDLIPEDIKLAEEVILHIVQPRVGFDQVRDTWHTSLKWLEDLVDLAAAAMDQARQPGAPTKPGSWCRWCRAKPICPSQQTLAVEALSKAPEAMSGVELAAALKLADQIKAWAASVYELAQQEMEGGAAVPGFKLVQKQPRRAWAIPEAEVEKKLRTLKMKVKEIRPPGNIISPTQLEKFDKEIYATVEGKGWIERKSSGLTVVPDSDKRAAVTSSMELLANAMSDADKA